MSSKITTCRNCGSKKLEGLFSLGKLSFTGKFPKKEKYNVPKDEIKLVKCKSCNLVQLNKNFNPKYLYGKDYGYRSGINKTMTDHLKKTAKSLSIQSKLKKNDFVLDIASNDGTLLNSYSKNVIKVGIDPIIYKFKKFYKNIEYPINNFFSFKVLKKRGVNKKFKIITALSVFYDLKKPNIFLSDISQIIHTKNGIFLLEHTDLLSIIKKNLFDTICHEHLEYYSVEVIKNMAQRNNLKIFDIEQNDINGGSVRFFICHKDAKFKSNFLKVQKYINEERKAGLKTIKCYKLFFNKVLKTKKILKNLIKKIVTDGKSIHGYGASTKGNVLLQFFNISKKEIPLIADRNIEKNNSFTPGTKIRIVTEEVSRKKRPNFFLVLPWHFKKEILKREAKIRKKGTKFIFPLPKLTIN